MELQLLFHIRQEFSQNDLPNLVQQWCFKNSGQSLGFRIRSRTRVFSTQKSNCSPSVVRVLSNFVLFPGCNQDIGSKFFLKIVSAVSYWPTHRCTGLFLASCFQLLFSEKTPRVALLLVSTWSTSCCQKYWLFSFHLLSNRIDDTNSPLLFRH